MFKSRFLLSALFITSLLFAQQAAVLHVLKHGFIEKNQQEKKASHTPACDQCASYAQLGGAATSTALTFASLTGSAVNVPRTAITLRSISVLSSAARGPPALQSNA